MFVDKLFIVAASASTADLAGTFLIRGPARHPVYLCSPGFGLERFESSQQALEHVRARLRVPAQRDELLRFVPLKIRHTFGVEPPPGLVTRPIQGVVLSDRRQSVQAYLDSTLNDLRDELLQLPSLTVLLNQLLENTLGARFPQVRLQAVRVISHDTSTGLPLRQVSIQTLGETLLEHYNRGGWPSGQSREFIAPDYSAQPAEITLWESTLATHDALPIYARQPVAGAPAKPAQGILGHPLEQRRTTPSVVHRCPGQPLSCRTAEAGTGLERNRRR